MDSNHRHGSGSSIELLEQVQQGHQSHNETAKGEKKQMRKYVDEYAPAEYRQKALREEGLSKDSNHRHGSGSSIELLEQAQQGHQSHNETSKGEKKQMRKYVDEYAPAEYRQKALREEGLSK